MTATGKSGAPPFVALYSAFAAAYFLSYFYRTINAVISPELTRELSLAPGALGFLTSAYFVAFAAMQLPLGMLLDRYGPRRVEPALLAVAASGALVFAFADTLPGLTLAPEGGAPLTAPCRSAGEYGATDGSDGMGNRELL